MSAHPHPTQRELIRLFIPLALSGIFFPLARPLINAALARSENPEWALAAFAVALSVTMPIMSPLFGLRQVTTALSTDKDMLNRIRTLTLSLGGLSTFLLLILCIPPIYSFFVEDIMAIPSQIAIIGAPVLLVLAITPILGVGRGYYQGILVHYKKAGPIGTGALFYVVSIGVVLFIGSRFLSIEGALLAAIALLIGQVFYVLIVALPTFPIIQNKMPALSKAVPDHNRSNKYLIRFFFPLAISTILTALVDPAIQTGMARAVNPTTSLAAYAIAASLGWLARTPLWNAQQIVISQATDQHCYEITKKFMIRLGIISTSIVALIGMPYVSDIIFTALMGVTGHTKALAISGFRWMLPLIFLQTLRSLYHGVLIRQGLTKQIQYASTLKLPAILVALFLGVWYGQIEGIYIAIGASFLSEMLEILWLHRASNRIEWNNQVTT